MALADITTKIIEEAKKKAAEILATIEKEIEKYKTDCEEALATQLQDIEEKVVQKKKAIDRKTETMVKMEERNRVLKVKQGLIHEAFEKAVEKIINISDTEYEKLLEKLCTAISIKEYTSGNLIPAKGKKSVTEHYVHKINPHIKIIDEGEFKGGFILQADKIEIDSTIEGTVLKDLKPMIESDVAKLLF